MKVFSFLLGFLYFRRRRRPSLLGDEEEDEDERQIEEAEAEQFSRRFGVTVAVG